MAPWSDSDKTQQFWDRHDAEPEFASITNPLYKEGAGRTGIVRHWRSTTFCRRLRVARVRWRGWLRARSRLSAAAKPVDPAIPGFGPAGSG